MSVLSHLRRPRIVVVLASLVCLLGAADAARAQTATRTPTPTRTPTATPTATATPQLVRLLMDPLTAKRQVGQFQNFLVTAFFSDGSDKNFTQKVIYQSSNVNVVFPPNTQGNAGRVEAVGIGTATISVLEPTTGVSSNSSNESAVMEVIEAPTPTPTRTGTTPTRTRTPTPIPTATPKLVSLLLKPLTAKRNVGQSQSFSVTGTFSDGNEKNMTQSVNYASSNPSVASAPNTQGNKGKVDAVGPGEAIISAIDPASGVSTTSTGGDAVFTVIVAPTPTPTRTGATPTKTFTPSPSPTSTPVLVSLAVGPSTAKRTAGSFQNFVATGTFSDGSTKNLTQRATYSSSNPSVAVPANAPPNRGKTTAIAVGVAIISAVDDVTGIASTQNAEFTVVEAPTPTPTLTGTTPTRTRTPTPTPTATPKLLSLQVSPVTAKRSAGSFQNFSCNGIYSDGSTKNMTQKVDYSSTNLAVANPTNALPPGNKGRVDAVGPGTATISARDPISGLVSTSAGGDAVFTVTEPPTPTPTHTGPTSTAPTGTRTFTPAPVPTATPFITSITLKPKEAQKPIGTNQFFTATATFSNGDTGKNVTTRVEYRSSDPTVAEATNEAGSPSKVVPLKVGTTVISAVDLTTGVSSDDSDGSAVLTVVQGNGTPNPRVTATPSLPIQTGNPTTACQRDVRRAARSFVDKKLKALDKCGAAAARCIQRKPGDPNCLNGVHERCAKALTTLAADEARLISTVTKRCAALKGADILGQDGLSYGELAPSCAARFGRTLTDLTSVAQCLTAQHACRTEALFALERPRAGELLRLVGAAPDAGACREDFGGNGAGVGDPKGVGKLLERCVKAIVRGGAGLTRTRLGSLGRCIDDIFLCVEASPGDAACLAKATAKCDREFAKVQRQVGKLTVTTAKACKDLDFSVLLGATGAYLDAVVPDCPSYGIPAVTTLSDYVACLVRQHECEVADLVRFESPRAAALLGQVGHTLVDIACPVP